MEFHYLTDEEFSKKRALWPFLKRIFICSLQYKSWFGLVLLSSGVVAAVDAIFPLLWLNYIDSWITPAITQHLGGEAVDVNGFVRYGGLFLGLFFGWQARQLERKSSVAAGVVQGCQRTN